MKKLLVIIAIVAVVVQTAIAGFGVSASGSTGTSVLYSASSGKSADFQSFANTNTVEGRITVAGTNWLAQVIAETNRAIVAEAILRTNWLAQVIAETNRARVAEEILGTNAVLSSRLSYALPYSTQTVSGVFTNVYDAKGISVSRKP
ncbi:MAG: hypothetical protein WCP34_06440 [Pseudomonadota bacterium]